MHAPQFSTEEKTNPRTPAARSSSAPISAAPQTRDARLRAALYGLDLFAILTAAISADVAYRLITGTFTSEFSLLLVGALMLGWTVIAMNSGVYTLRQRVSQSMNITRAAYAAVVLILVALSTLYITEAPLPRQYALITLVLVTSLLMMWRLIARASASLLRSKRAVVQTRVLIVGANNLGQQVASMITQSWTGSQIIGFVDDEMRGSFAEHSILGGLDDVVRLINERAIGEVVVALPNNQYDALNKIVIALKSLPVNVSVVPDFLSLALYRPSVSELGGLPLINLTEPALTVTQRMVKRAFDIAISGTALLIASPVMLLIALAIRLDSEGPILFRQDRIGENGKVFKMYKFRSMVANAERLQALVNTVDANGNTIHKRRNDPRVTRVGRIIRKTSLDELPQLLNVLNGTMSIVGPRPELPWMVEDAYQPWQHRRFAVPQGITGWWQVTGRADKPMHLNTEQDLYYIQNYSFWLDLKIILKTVPALARGKGAF
ncbi:MAG TPA: sugar transferase [Aggregatilineales bacterium]|nr:sugar transferase [Aggregatilineales bacterium]